MYGGALYSGGSVTIENCTFSKNACSPTSPISAEGGAVYNYGVLEISNSIFVSNWVQGAMAATSDSPHNPQPPSAAGYGGAICNAGGTVTLNGVTFFGNRASGGVADDTTFQGPGRGGQAYGGAISSIGGLSLIHI